MAYRKRDSLGIMFNQKMVPLIKKMTYEKQLILMKHLANDVCKSFKKNREFYNITGNTYTSFYAVVFHQGKQMYIASSSENEAPPTRVTLKKGETYDLPQYYGGDSIGDKHPYTGKIGKGGQWGPNLFYGRMGKFGRPDGEWSLMCVCPVEYARFNENILKTVYETYEGFDKMVGLRVMLVKNSSVDFER